MFNFFGKKQKIVEGSTSEKELAYLVKMVNKLAEGDVVIEVGSHRGRSAIAMGKAAKQNKSKVYAIDPHLQFRGVNGRVFGPADLAYMYHAIVEHDVGEFVFVVCLHSTAAAQAWDDMSVSLVFLDGDHSPGAVRADADAWSSKIKTGGVIAFHDSSLPGVSETIDLLEADPKWSRCGVAGSIVALKREDV